MITPGTVPLAGALTLTLRRGTQHAELKEKVLRSVTENSFNAEKSDKR